jgi:translocation and assembly module TamB
VPALAFRGRLNLDGRRGAFRLGLPQLELRSGGSVVTLKGQLLPRLALTSQQLRLGSELTQAWPSLRPVLGVSPQLVGQLGAGGRAAQPVLQLDLAQAANPLLGAVQTKLRWADQVLTLESLQAPGLAASATLPLRLAAGGRVVLGDLNLALDLSRYPLKRLTPLVGARRAGELSAHGRLQGPIRALRPDLALVMAHPGAGPLDLEETWAGSFGPRGELRLRAGDEAPAGELVARIDRRWLPDQVRLSRGTGLLELAGSPRHYHWTARGLPLDGLSLRLAQAPGPLPLRGSLSGRGSLDLQPLAMAADGVVTNPALPGLPGRQLQAQARYRAGAFSLQGEWQAKRQGQLAFQLGRRPDGALWSRLEGRSLDSDLLTNLRLAWSLWHPVSPGKGGAAQDLGSLAIDTLGTSLSDQLAALALAKQHLNSLVLPGASSHRELPLANLQALVDADVTLGGPSLARLAIDLEVRGHLWLRDQTMDRALGDDPFIAKLQGPLQNGQGRFSFKHLPLALLALAGPLPASFSGGLAASGSYRLGGPRPLLWSELVLDNGRLGDQPLALERGSLELQNQAIALDLSLRSQGASNGVDLKGRIPLEAQRDGLELRLASRGDGLRFLTALAGKGLTWTSGSTDLQLLVRGSVAEPIANGFLRCRDGSLTVAGQAIRDLQAMVLFDFQNLDLQQLTAKVGSTGQLTGSGQLPLFDPGVVERPLKLVLTKAPFSVAMLSGIGDGAIELAGSLRRPELRGELGISQGAITVRLGALASEAKPGQAVTVPQLVEQGWDFQRPLQVFSSDQESSAGRSLRAAVPNLPLLGLGNLRLRFGPNLRVVVPTVGNFNTTNFTIKGLLTLNGHLDPSLQASGVVRLLSGRLGLFTTTFNLDPEAPNVAVFTPSLGLVPYLDIAMRTRVSDSRNTIQGDRSSIYDWAQAGTPGSFDQLNLVKVVVTVSGPADRLAESIQIRSTPPMSQERLVALIGGNSLAGLSDGNAGAALATVLGQSLLSPLVSSLSDVMGQRVSFALYPTYVVPASQTPGGTTGVGSSSGNLRLPSQLVLGSEIGIDLTERFNASVLAAPNRSDIPPQMTLRYQASDRVGVQGSLDTLGRWQTQLQLYYRF